MILPARPGFAVTTAAGGRRESGSRGAATQTPVARPGRREMLVRRASPLALLLGLLLLLAACSSTPTPSSSSSSRPAKSTSSGGGYYLDDGPGTNAPTDLSAIPDARPRREAILARTTRPYVIFGRTYTPRSELVPYREQGVASWYGRKFHGQKTSSGEVYDMYAMTAAHPTLPIPSYVRVTSLVNGNSVVVRVNDRGPFLNNRLIDLSWTAAAKLGYVNAGHSRVEVEQITQFDTDDGMPMRAPENLAAVARPAVEAPSASAAPAAVVRPTEAEAAAAWPANPGAGSVSASASASVPAPATPNSSAASSLAIEAIVAAANTTPSSAPQPAAIGDVDAASFADAGHYVQLAAYSSRDSAEAGRAMLARQAEWIVPRVQVRLDGGLYKLRAGPYPQRELAQQAAERLRQTTELKPIMMSR